MSSISTGTTTTTGYVVASDTTGSLVLKTGASATTAVTIDTSQNATFAKTANLPNTFGFKNRIINGAMVIDQRNAGAAVTLSDEKFPLDRFICRAMSSTNSTAQQSSTVPAGFNKSLLYTVGTGAVPAVGDRNLIFQIIEGYNFSDLGWGAAGAQTVTLSFWVRSSLTGTFGGALANGGLTRSYPFTYTINAANTFEYKTITIAGDTTGTWLTTNGNGVIVWLDMGCGSTYLGTAGAWASADYRGATGDTKLISTTGATFYITGVQLEVGTVATSFDYRPYGTELALCQRYCYVATNPMFIGSAYASNLVARAQQQFPVTMRATPTTTFSGTIAWLSGNNETGRSTSINTTYNNVNKCELDTTLSSGSTFGVGACCVAFATTSFVLTQSAEL
jgi:hypothetical protein